jgi:hypothetical protein
VQIIKTGDANNSLGSVNNRYGGASSNRRKKEKRWWECLHQGLNPWPFSPGVNTQPTALHTRDWYLVSIKHIYFEPKRGEGSTSRGYKYPPLLFYFILLLSFSLSHSLISFRRLDLHIFICLFWIRALNFKKAYQMSGSKEKKRRRRSLSFSSVLFCSFFFLIVLFSGSILILCVCVCVCVWCWFYADCDGSGREWSICDCLFLNLSRILFCCCFKFVIWEGLFMVVMAFSTDFGFFNEIAPPFHWIWLLYL